jgi:hypothetical protein
MSNLDERRRDPNTPRGENMVQYAFNQYNKTRDTLESMKETPKIYRIVQQAREKYRAAKEKMQEKNEQTPVVTAQDIKDEMYR